MYTSGREKKRGREFHGQSAIHPSPYKIPYIIHGSYTRLQWRNEK